MEIEENVEPQMMRPPDKKSQSSRTSLWEFFGQVLPRSEIVFLSQMIVIYAVIAVSLVNLTRGSDGDGGKLWIALLSSCLGYILPNPKIER